MNEVEQGLKKLEAVVAKQGEQIANLLEILGDMGKLIGLTRNAQMSHQRIFESLHAVLVQKGLIAAADAPESAIN